MWCFDVLWSAVRFIEGAARLRGSAKAIDVWRLETKVEVPVVVGRPVVVGMLKMVDVYACFGRMS